MPVVIADLLTMRMYSPFAQIAVSGAFIPMAGQERDRRRKDYEPKTDFQRWMKPRMEALGMDYTLLHRGLLDHGMSRTENYIYRVMRGDPDVYKNVHPGYALALAIGECLGDVPGALTAAGYPLQKRETPNGQEILEIALGKWARLTYRTGERGAPFRITEKTLRILRAIHDTETEEGDTEAGEDSGSVGGERCPA